MLTVATRWWTMRSIHLRRGILVRDLSKPTGLARNLLICATSVALVTGLAIPAAAADFDVSTVAGVPGETGPDDGAGIGGDEPLAKFVHPAGITTLGGKIYIVDVTRIRRYDPVTNQVVTLVGTTEAAYVDGNFATARFKGLFEITAFEGDLYVGDDHRIRKIDLDALTVTTIAGSATPGSIDGVGAAASFNDVRGPFAHRGMLYVADASDRTLRSVDPDTAQVTTLAGMAGSPASNVDGFGTNARFNSPRNMAAEGKYIYISDTNGAVIRRYNIDTTEVTTVVGDGTPETLDGIGTAAHVLRPRGMTVWGGYLWFADFNDHIIRRMDLVTLEVVTVAGTAGDDGFVDDNGADARFSSPWGAIAMSGDLYITDQTNYLLRKMEVPLADTSVTLNVTKTAQKATAKGKVLPAQPGGEVVVALFRKSNGAFKKKSQKAAVLSDSGSYSASFNRLGAGSCKFTTRWPGDADSTASKKSAVFAC